MCCNKYLLLILSTLFGINCFAKKFDITFPSLLKEMIDYEEAARFPLIQYSTGMESSYDRRSVHPDSAGWCANNDGFGIIRIDTINGEKESVLFDQQGPGVITRFWLTSTDKNGVIKFYFNHSSQPQWIIPNFDLIYCGLNLGEGFLQAHPNYTSTGKGGSTLFLPIPYSNGCKITMELPDSVERTPKYYQINYRSYPSGTKIETFSLKTVLQEKRIISKVNTLLLQPPTYEKGNKRLTYSHLLGGDSISISLPKGTNAIHNLEFVVKTDTFQYEQTMRELILKIEFDGKETVCVPLSDFSGGGMGARKSQSWYLQADGKGNILSRWVMPYRKKGTIKIINLSAHNVDIKTIVGTNKWKWDKRSLYFHASWRQQNKIHVEANPENIDSCIEWNFAKLKGRGVYKGDALTLFNHTLAWYGEGDEKIWVDDDSFPSHFGTGTEDYYNCSWAPVIPFYTPFGGANRADAETATGYNTFFRTRNLDQIPFVKKLVFNIEMLSWISGFVDYASTVYWYGDWDSFAENCTSVNQTMQPLLPQPKDPAKFKITENAIEFEKLTPVNHSKELFLDIQSMLPFQKGLWSSSKQLLCTHGKIGSFIEYFFDVDNNEEYYDITIFATKAPDYGIISFYVNGQKSPVEFDGCSYPTYNVINSMPIQIGKYRAVNGEIHLKIEISGRNNFCHGKGSVFGLDCLTIENKK